MASAYTTSYPGGVFADGSTYTVANTLNVVGVSFKKTWQKDFDGTTSDLSSDDIAQLVQSNAMPATIKVRYRYAYQKGDTWSDWADVTQTSGSTTAPVERTLSFNEATGTYLGTTTISNFPRYTVVDDQLCPTRYVAYEYALTYANGTTDVTANAVPSGTNAYADDAGALTYRFAATGVSDAGIAGKLVRSETSTNGTVGSYDSTVVNTIPVKQLTVRKTWDDDGNRDGYRPDSLAFSITRDGTAVADGLTLTSSDALPSDAYTGGTGAISYTSGNGPDWDALGKNQKITAKDVWQKSMLVPVWKSVVSSADDKSSYAVKGDTLDANYQKLFSCNNASDATDYTVAGAGTANDLGTTGTQAFFVNVHAPWDTFSIAPAKTWYYNGHQLGGADSPALLAAYARELADSGYTLALQLQYKLDGVSGKSDWQAIDADGNSDFDVLDVKTGDDGKISAEATGASLASVATAKSIGDDGAVTFSYALNKTENGTTTTVSRDGATSWAGLPLYWHTGDASAQKIPYQYRVVEGYVDGNGTFTAIDDADTGALTNFTSDHSTGHTGADVTAGSNGAVKDATAAATVSNTLKTTGITVAKNWTDTNNAYLSRPDSVTFHLEYTTSSDDSAWENVPQGWAAGTGSDAAGTATVTLAKGADGSFASQTVNNLPERDASGAAYRYRAVEDSYTYGTGAAAKIYTVGTTADSTTAGVQNPYYADATAVVQGSSDGTVTFANKLVTTSFAVTKTWAGDDAWNLHNDIDHVTVKLQHRSTASGAWTDVPSGTYDLTAGDNNWSHTWDDLPKIDGTTGNAWEYRGVEVSYTLAADKGGVTVFTSYASTTDPTSGIVGAYTYSSQTSAASVDAPATTAITNTLITGTVNASKKWDDDNNRDNVRPAQATLTLTASGTQGLTLPTISDNEVAVATDGTQNEGATSWSGLPVFDASGAKISYTVGEQAVSDYTASAPAAVQLASGTDGAYAATAAALVNSRTPQTTQVTTNKTWSDNNDYGDRPTSVAYTLHATVDGAELSAPDLKVKGLTDLSRTVSVASDGAASTTWDNLPVYQPGKVGKKIVYTVTETQPTGYEAPVVGADTGSDAGHTFGVTNTMPYTSLTVSKSWADDFGVNAGIATVAFALQRSSDNGATWTDLPQKTYDLQKADDGTWPSVTLGNLPAKNTKTGADYVYRAVETGYTLSDGKTVVTAVPSSTATADGKLTGTVGAYTFESKVDTTAKTTELSNTLVLGELNVTKAFNDANNQDNKRPDSIGLTLTNDKGIALGDKATKTIAIANATGWSQSWTGADALPVKAADGSAVTYTVAETDYNAKATDGNQYAGSHVVGTGATQQGDSAQVTLDAKASTQVAFTNSEAPDTVDVTATKKWSDNNAFGDRPANVTFTLHAKYDGAADELTSNRIKETLKADTSKTLSAADATKDDANAWAATWSGLPKNMPGQVGKQLAYWVTEDTTPTGYAQASYNVKTTVTNTMDKKTTLTVKSSWANEIYGVGAKSATFKLQRMIEGGTWTDVSTTDATNHPVTTTITKSKENATDDSYTFSDLPMYSAEGKAYSYRAVQTSLTPKADAADTPAKPASDSDATKGTVGGYTYASSTTGDATDGFITSNTNTMTRGSVTVTKSYEDAQNQDGTRPESATFTLSADQKLMDTGDVLQAKTIDTPDRVQVSAAGWTYTWDNLPTQMADGTTIKYTVTEGDVSGYAASYSINGGSASSGNAATTPVTSAGVKIAFTNTHDPAKTSVTATKKWEDNNNAYGDRPGSVTYTLHAKAGEAELSAADLGLGDAYSLERTANVASDAAGAASATWDNLPVYQPGAQGQKIAYSVTESRPASYQEPAVGADTGDDAGGHAFEVTNALDPLTYTVEKKWENEPGFLTVKADAATFKLQRSNDGGKSWSDVEKADEKTVTRMQDAGDTAHWDGLPKYDKNGNAYSYRAVETSIGVDKQTVAATPTDTGDPTSGTVGGYAYSSAVNENGEAKTTVTNSFRTAKLSVSQSWDDDANRDGKRQAKTVTVTADPGLNGMPQTFTLATDRDAGLAGEVDNLPVTDAAGTPITYTVTEDAIDGYSASYALGNDKGATPVSTTLEKGDATVSITNKYTPATRTVTATKVWDDQSNAYGDRPDKVQFTLYAQPDGGDKYQVTEDESGKAVANPMEVKGGAQANTWTTEWSKLPAYQPGEVGKKIAYTVEESAVAGYEKSESGLTVTNTQDTTALTATKEWGSDPANIGRDVAGVTIALERSTDGSNWNELTAQHVAKSGGSQQVSWTGLPTHDAQGRAYSYRAVEKSLDLNDKDKTQISPSAAESGTVGGYDYQASTAYAEGADETSRPGTGSYATTIANTPASGSLKVTKTWTDDNNRDNLRKPVTATLSAKAGKADYGLGDVGLTQTLSADGWNCTWNNLPVKNAAGDAISYTVTEGDAPEGYSKTQGSDTHELVADDTTSFSLENTHTPGTISVTASKTWSDDDNASAARPDTVTYTLQFKHDNADWVDASSIDAGYRQTVDVAKDAAGAASFTWENLPAYYKGSAGDQIHYRVVEAPVNGYAVAYSAEDVSGTPLDNNANKTITVTNTLQTTGLSVAKTWNDSFGISKTVTATNYKVQRSLDGVAWSDYQRNDATVAGSIARDATTTSWQGLPAFDLATGTAWKYRAVETGLTVGGSHVDASISDAAAGTGTVGGFSCETGAPSFDSETNIWSNEVTNSVLAGAASVAKAWDDDKNRDGVRPGSVGVTLSAVVGGKALALEGVTVDQSLTGESAAESWTADKLWVSLPVADAAGNKITYTVAEGDVPEGYTKTQGSASRELSVGQTTTFSLENTHTPETAKVTATKKWDDQSNLYGDRPDAATLTLHASYAGSNGAVELSPEQIAGTLNADKAKTLDASNAKSDDANAWTVAWDGLPSFMPGQVGKKLAYWVTEDKVPAGYQASSSADSLTITNALDPLTYTVEKKWEDEPGFLTAKADAATFKLQRTTDGKGWTDVKEAGEKTVARTQDAGDAVSWSDLPKYDQNGKAYTYRAIETSIGVDKQTVAATPTDTGDPTSGTVGGYAYSSSIDQAKTTVTNSFRTAKLSVSQSWDDDHNRDGKRQAKTVTVSAGQDLNGMPTAFTLEIGKDAGLAGEIDNLPVTDAAGSKIAYTVTEDTVDGYSTSYALNGSDMGASPVSTTLEGGDATVAIVNTHTPGTLSVATAKQWSDQGNNTGFRPATLAFTLQMKHAGADWADADATVLPTGVAATQTVDVARDAEGAAGFTWEGLPAFYPGGVGDAVTYRVIEAPAAGYSSACDSDTVSGTAADDHALKAVVFTNTLDPVSYTFAKADETGAPLAGTTLTLAGTFAQPDGTTVEETRTVLDGAESADLSDNSLIKGERYTLSEQVPTAGYTCAEDATVTVGGDGALSVVSPDGRVTASADGHAVTVRDVPTAATVTKRDAKGQPLAGATYRVEAADGSAFADGTTEQVLSVGGDGATAELRGLLVVGDRYRMVETAAPAGYYLNDEVLGFTVNRDGTLAFENAAGLASYAGDGTDAIVQTDVPVALRIQKANAGDGSFDLSGAIFALAPTKANAKTKAAVESDEIATAPTDAQGATDLSILQLSAHTDYTVTETAAPAGFKLDASPVAIHVADDGTVSLAGEAPAAYTLAKDDDGVWVLTCADEPFDLHLQKTDENGQPLEGATLDISGDFADGSTDQQAVSDAQGMAAVGALLVPGATYTLAESQAPEGFDALSQPARFTMDETGVLTLIDDADGQVALGDGGRTLVVVDQPTPDASLPAADVLARTGDDAPFLPLAGLLGSAAVAIFARRSLRRREEGDRRA